MDFFVPFMVLLVSIFLARIINERSYKTISTEEKARLIDLFSRSRIVGLAIVIVMIAFLFFAPRWGLLSFTATLAVYIAALIIYFAAFTVYSFRVLRRNGYELLFIRLYSLSIVVRFAGLAIFFAFFSGDISRLF